MFASPLADGFFGSIGTDKFIQYRLFFSGDGTQDPAQPLNVFTDTAAAGNDDADGCLRDVDTLIEDFAGDQHRVIAGTEIVENFFPPLWYDG